MKKNLLFLAIVLVVVVAVAQAARRGRAPIVDPVAVNPLDGYAGQIYNDDAPVIDMQIDSFSLLDDPSK